MGSHWACKPLLWAGSMPSGRWSTQNGINGILKVLRLVRVCQAIFTIQILCMYIVVDLHVHEHVHFFLHLLLPVLFLPLLLCLFLLQLYIITLSPGLSVCKSPISLLSYILRVLGLLHLRAQTT